MHRSQGDCYPNYTEEATPVTDSLEAEVVQPSYVWGVFVLCLSDAVGTFSKQSIPQNAWREINNDLKSLDLVSNILQLVTSIF